MRFIKTTIIGGLVFLVPIGFLLFVLSEVVALMAAVAEPLADVVPVDSIAGIATANVIAVLALLLICFVAGLVAGTRPARKFAEKMEAAVLSKVPGYAMFKGYASSFSSDQQKGLKPVLVRRDDHERVGLEVEQVDENRRAVYFPGAPNAWAGTVEIVPIERIQRLNAPMAEVIAHAELIGKSSAQLLSQRYIRTGHD